MCVRGVHDAQDGAGPAAVSVLVHRGHDHEPRHVALEADILGNLHAFRGVIRVLEQALVDEVNGVGAQFVERAALGETVGIEAVVDQQFAGRLVIGGVQFGQIDGVDAAEDDVARLPVDIQLLKMIRFVMYRHDPHSLGGGVLSHEMLFCKCFFHPIYRCESPCARLACKARKRTAARPFPCCPVGPAHGSARVFALACALQTSPRRVLAVQRT